MNTNLPPIIEDVFAMHFPRMKGLRRVKVQPCDHCGLGTCNHFPCENVTNPDYSLTEIRAPEGARS